MATAIKIPVTLAPRGSLRLLRYMDCGLYGMRKKHELHRLPAFSGPTRCIRRSTLAFVVFLFVEIPVEEAADGRQRLARIGPRHFNDQSRARLGGEREHL